MDGEESNKIREEVGEKLEAYLDNKHKLAKEKNKGGNLTIERGARLQSLKKEVTFSKDALICSIPSYLNGKWIDIGEYRIKTNYASHLEIRRIKTKIPKTKKDKGGSFMRGKITTIALLVTAAFFALKVLGYIDWGWVWVFAPIWLVGAVALLLLMGVLTLIGIIFKGVKNDKRSS